MLRSTQWPTRSSANSTTHVRRPMLPCRKARKRKEGKLPSTRSTWANSAVAPALQPTWVWTSWSTTSSRLARLPSSATSSTALSSPGAIATSTSRKSTARRAATPISSPKSNSGARSVSTARTLSPAATPATSSLCCNPSWASCSRRNSKACLTA